MPAPALRVYPRYSVVAEKLETIIALGMLNSRMKDYFDLWVLTHHSTFDIDLLRSAILTTLRWRKTLVGTGDPIGLSDEFAQDPAKQKQWDAFLRKNRIDSKPLDAVVSDLRAYLLPLLTP